MSLKLKKFFSDETLTSHRLKKGDENQPHPHLSPLPEGEETPSPSRGGLGGDGVFSGQKGVALVVALLMSVAIMALVAGVLYFITQSTTMSGAGKRYATASEAADGAVEVVKDAVNLIMRGEPDANVANVFDSGPGAGPDGAADFNCRTGSAAANIVGAILNNNNFCNTYIQLPGTGPGTLGGTYTAAVRIERLYSAAIPGGRLGFAEVGGVGSTAVYYRITATVTSADGTTAENSVLYRYV